MKPGELDQGKPWRGLLRSIPLVVKPRILHLLSCSASARPYLYPPVLPENPAVGATAAGNPRLALLLLILLLLLVLVLMVLLAVLEVDHYWQLVCEDYVPNMDQDPVLNIPMCPTLRAADAETLTVVTCSLPVMKDQTHWQVYRSSL